MIFFTLRSYHLFVLSLFLPSGFTQDTCYFPDGSIAKNGVPCGPSPSACCDGDGICLSNGLCFQPSGNLLARSSCTDSTWSSNSCTTICKTVKVFQYMALTPCGSNLFCCNLGPDATECCLGDLGKFIVDDSTVELPASSAATVTVTATVTSTKTNTVVSTVTTSLVSTSIVAAGGGVFTSTQTVSVTVSTTTTSISCANNPTLAGNVKDKTTTVTLYSGATNTPGSFGDNSQIASTSSEDCSKKEVAIGAGIGASLLLALIVALLLLFCRNRHFRRPWTERPPPAPMLAHENDINRLAPDFANYGAAATRPPGQYRATDAQTSATVRDPMGINELQAQSPVSLMGDGRHELDTKGGRSAYEELPPRY